jgi:hypothetical protein
MAKRDDQEVPATPTAVAPAVERTDSDIRREKQSTAKETARERAAAAVGRYRVTVGNLTGEYDARDAREAWAMFCDAHKTWPSPKFTQKTIEKVA